MTVEDDTATLVDAQENADFASGFTPDAGKPTEKPTADRTEPEAAPEGATVEAEEKPEYVQISAKDWAEVRAAAAKTASYDQQLSKAFGTIGNLSKQIAEQKAAGQPAAAAATAKKIEIQKDAFNAMRRDFPELADQIQTALETALSGIPVGSGANDADPAKLENLLATYNSRREIEVLEDQFPDWRDIVGAVDVTRETPPDNAFRKWLGTKDSAYQQRINGSESAAIIGRAIRTFQRETAAPAKPAAAAKPRDDARAERIRAAVQPRGDNAGAAAGKSDDDMFEEGFRSR